MGVWISHDSNYKLMSELTEFFITHILLPKHKTKVITEKAHCMDILPALEASSLDPKWWLPVIISIALWQYILMKQIYIYTSLKLYPNLLLNFYMIIYCVAHKWYNWQWSLEAIKCQKQHNNITLHKMIRKNTLQSKLIEIDISKINYIMTFPVKVNSAQTKMKEHLQLIRDGN